MKQKGQDIFKIIEKNSGISISILVTVIFCFLVPFIFVNDKGFYLTWISAISGVATMFLAFILFDRLDSKKAAFSRELDAVDKLASALFHLDFYAIPGNKQVFKNLYPREYIRFSINNRSIAFAREKHKEHFSYKVYFSIDIIEILRNVAALAQNIWVPIAIKDILKPAMMPDTITLMETEFNGEFMLITGSEDLKKIITEYYSFSYEELTIENIEDLINKFELIIFEFSKYYMDRLGVIPDFEGH